MSADGDAERASAEVALLETDARLVMRTVSTALQTQPIDSPTSDHANYMAVTGDLFREAVEHVLAVGILLRLGSFTSASVVARAAYEHAIGLIYMITRGDKIQNALLCRARALLEMAEAFGDQPSGHEAEGILGRMPPGVVTEAKRRKKARHGWSGATVDQMATEIGVVGHREVYRFLSWAVHGRLGGHDVVEERNASGDVRMNFAPRVEPKDIHALANFTRRVLHLVYRRVVGDWLGRVPPLATSDPELGRAW